MSRKRKRIHLPLIAAMTVFFTLALGMVAVADNVVADGDGLAPLVAGTGVSFGSVCEDASPDPQKTVLLAINRVGAGNVYANSASIAVSVSSVTGSGLSATNAANIGLPPNWTSLSNNTLSSTVTSTVTLDPSSLPAGAYSGSITYSAVGADAGGGTLTRTATVTVTATIQDCNTPPTLSLPADITAEAEDASGAVVSYTVTASDTEDDPDPTPSCSPVSGSTFGLGTTIVNCSVTDSSGATATGSFMIVVDDTTDPILSLADQTLEATGPLGAVATFSPSASDLVDGTVPVLCDADSGDTFPLGTTTVGCSATDAHGNVAGGSFTITVVDTTPPALTLPADITIEAAGPSGTVVDFVASGTDIVDGSMEITCSPVSGSTFPLGETTVSCSATDAAGNTASGSFDITVVDTTPPSLSLPSNITAEATGPGGAAVSFTANATDLVDGAITPTCSPASGSTFALGTTSVGCSATDVAGNTASGSFDVTVVDTTPPDVTVPGDITAEATSPGGAAVTFSASATDLVDGSLPVTCSPASGSTFALDTTTTVTCSATDAAGNSGSNSFTVTVLDTTPPTIDPHADITAIATSAAGAVVSYSSPATHDAVDGDGTATCTPLSGSTFPVGSTTVTCDATDAHGNAAAPTTFQIHVVYDWAGFFQPVNNRDAYGSYIFNVVKAGQAIPMKFGLGGDMGLSILKANHPVSKKVPCEATSPTDSIEETVTAGGSTLTFDSLANQYVYVWKTDKAWAGTCRVFDLGLNDGTTHVAYFKFTK